MSKSDIKAGAAYVELGLKDAAFVRGIAKAGERLQSFGRGVSTFGAGVTAMGAAIVGPMLKSVLHFAQVGDELDEMSARTGATTQFLSEMGFAAELAGQSLGAVEKGLIGSQKFVSDASLGLQTAKDGLDALGLSLSDFDGLDAEGQFDLITGRLDGMEDATKRNAAAMLVFGKRMGPAIASITDGLADARAEARDLGLVPSDEEIANAAKISDAIDKIKRVLSATFFEIGSALAPAVLPVLDTIQRILVAVQRWVASNGDLFIVIAKVGVAITAAGGLITGLGVAIFAVGTILGGVASAISFFGTVLGVVISPLGLLSAAIVAGVFAWAKWTDSGKRAVNSIRTVLGPVLDVFKETFAGIQDAIAGGDLSLAFEIAVAGIKLAFAKLVFSLQDQFKPFIETMLGAWDIILTVWDGATAAIKFAWDTLTSLLMDAWEGVSEFFGFGTSDMAGTWDGFAEGLVAVFTQVSRVLIDIWEGTVNTLANMLIDSGVFDDGAAELTRLKNGELLRDAQRRVRLLSSERDAIAAANVGDTVSIGGEDKVVQQNEAGEKFVQGDETDITVADFDKMIASAIESAEKDGVDPDKLQRDSVTDFTSSVSSSLRKTLDGVDRRAQDRPRKSIGELLGIDKDLIANELAKLTDRSAALREEADAKRERDRKAVEQPDLDEPTQTGKIFSTFSSAAAFALQSSFGGNVDPAVEEQRKTNELAREQLLKLDETNERLRDINANLSVV